MHSRALCSCHLCLLSTFLFSGRLGAQTLHAYKPHTQNVNNPEVKKINVKYSVQISVPDAEVNGLARVGKEYLMGHQGSEEQRQLLCTQSGSGNACAAVALCGVTVVS